jgi:hypothetical protein
VLGPVRYFEQTFGLKQQWIWGGPPVYAGVHEPNEFLLEIAESREEEDEEESATK